jgi:uncharacterized protein YndB with AHSA1/START domain
MPKVTAARELLASREDVWGFLAEPRHFADWWPGVADVRPDRRGLAPGARWEIVGAPTPSLFRRPASSGTLLVRDVHPLERWTWYLTGEHIDADLALAARGPDRTVVTLTLDGWALLGLGRSMPRRALGRLHALCQTAAEL